MEFIKAPCDHCENRQQDLDPHGCFRQVSQTGTAGRLARSMFGCERFRDTRDRIVFKMSEPRERIFFRITDTEINEIIRLAGEHEGDHAVTREIFSVIGKVIAREPGNGDPRE